MHFNYKNQWLLFVLAFVLFTGYVEANTIILDSGKTYEGAIVERGDNYIKVDLDVGVPITFYLDEIDSIDGKPLEEEVPEAVVVEEPDDAQILFVDEGKSFIWEVKSDTTTAYILGSIHVADESFYPLPVAIEKPFQNADVLVVEADIFNMDQLELAQQIQELGVYKGGRTLKDDISEETFMMLKEYLAQFNADVTPFLLLKPWMVSMAIEELEANLLGLNSEFGIDIHFLRLATGRKRIVELESLEMQLDLMSQLSNQDTMLHFTLVDLERQRKILKDLVRAWKNGNARKLNKLIVAGVFEDRPELDDFYDEFFLKRNDKMFEKVKGFLQTKDIYYVVVGAGHLVGERGIIRQLEKAGYKLKQL